MASTLTPNMSLIVPTVGQEAGPNYALDVNNDLSILDAHNHSAGSGVQITPAGLNINSALTLNSNFLTAVAGVTLTAQSSTPANGTLFENNNSSGDLYYVNAAGLSIQLTNASGIVGTSGSISGISGTASASYSSPTFFWRSATGIAANMDFGSAIMRNISPNSTYALTLSPPATLSSNYSLTLPALPVTTTIMTLNSSGQMAGTYTLDPNTISTPGNVITVITTPKAPPTSQFFTNPVTGGTYNKNYTFVVSPANATVGATYTNNSVTFTVYATVSSSTQVVMSGSGAPLSSGTLTLASGTGDATITFSQVIAPLYIEVEMCGAGAGGSGGGVNGTSGNGSAGTGSSFSSFLVAGGGAQGSAVSEGGLGGTPSVSSPAVGFSSYGGPGGGSVAAFNAGIYSGGIGGSNAFGAPGTPNYSSSSGTSSGVGPGSGGAGGGTLNSATGVTGAGGGAGAYLKAIIPNPASTYIVTVGSGGTGGGAGSNGSGGGNGANGIIIVREYYQ